MAQARALRAAADGLAPQVQVDEESRRRVIVTDEVAHQDIEDVVIDSHYIV